jgi:hypothetical protein
MLYTIRLSILIALSLIPHASMHARYTHATYHPAYHARYHPIYEPTTPLHYVSDFQVAAALGVVASISIYSTYAWMTQRKAEHSAKKNNREKLHDFTLSSVLQPYEDALQRHLQNIAKAHHNLEGVTFLPTETNYYTDSSTNTIYIPTHDYVYLLYSIHPNRIIIKTEQELERAGLSSYTDLQDKLKEGKELIGVLHIDNLFNGIDVPHDNIHRIEGSLHHELGHIKHESTMAIKTLNELRFCAVLFPFTKLYIYTAMLDNYPKSMVGDLTFNYKAIFAAIASTLTAYPLYRQYDETRADDTVPNDTEKLRALESYFREKHNYLMEIIKTDPSSLSGSIGKFFALTIPYSYWEKMPQLTCLFHLFTDHPSDYYRAERFKERLDALKIAQAIPKTS